MSLIRFLYDPDYTVDDFGHFTDDAYNTRFRTNSGAVSKRSKPFSPKYVHYYSTKPPKSNQHLTSLDLHEDKEKNLVIATLDLPGLKKEDVTIDVHNDRLVISGETSTSTTEENKDTGYHVRERRFGKFSRTISLSKGTKATDVKAQMENGVLTVTFPKTQPEQAPHRIAID